MQIEIRVKSIHKSCTKDLNLLVKNPEIGRPTDDETIRGLIVDGFVLYYEVTSDKIIGHTVWDCRQNPDDLKMKWQKLRLMYFL